ncbi:16570_t:CDS:1, partial [Acaulospora colombiana]
NKPPLHPSIPYEQQLKTTISPPKQQKIPIQKDPNTPGANR